MLDLILNVFLLSAPKYFPENIGDACDLAIVQTEWLHDQKVPPLDVINWFDSQKAHDSVQIWKKNLPKKNVKCWLISVDESTLPCK